ncbi:NAD(P)H-binding protein [Desulfoluna spongiiphila]|uniref:NAD(P)H-binding protein n=1 Tax=Desulfoluna spongiiphila TaxID=419481 RepID=UPI001257F45B|nr:NAD(P)H-binding protein [Desulfoluna spongiiphila]VVS91297.1 nad(p)-binding domain [Desulfoluna spongiiphila]
MPGMRIMMAGATGLVGGSFFNRAVADSGIGQIVLLGRRSVPELEAHGKVTSLVADFNKLDAVDPSCEVDAMVCALGTTLKKAGSRERLFEVDCLYTEAAAAYALRCGARTLVVISSVGASPTASSHYLRTKGEMEKRVTALGYPACHILRPSLLTGARGETRLGESLAARLLSPVSFLLPAAYRPVHADTLAEKIHTLLKEPGEGVRVHGGGKHR